MLAREANLKIKARPHNNNKKDPTAEGAGLCFDDS